MFIDKLSLLLKLFLSSCTVLFWFYWSAAQFISIKQILRPI